MTTSQKTPLRLACFGLPLAPFLLALDGHDVRLSVLAPVTAPGRRRLAARIGQERILDARTAGDALDERIRRALAVEAPDLIVSWFWTRRLPAEVLETARFGAIGVHPSLLPKYRGPNPYYAAIDAGDRETGVTVHRLTPRYDDGDVLFTRALAVKERDSWQLARALDRPSLALLREAVACFARGAVPAGTPQHEELATFAPEPAGEALRVDWSWPTERVLRRIRALTPVPGLSLDVEGLSLVVLRARESASFPAPLVPGEGAVVGDPPCFVLRTVDGAVAVERGTFDTDDGGEGAFFDGAEVAAAIREHLAGRRAQVRPI